jgi:hypothetical protein
MLLMIRIILMQKWYLDCMSKQDEKAGPQKPPLIEQTLFPGSNDALI